jgi:hypothetical protein
MTDEKEYQVTFYFSSGETLIVIYSKEKLSELFTTIRKSWNQACIANYEFGINFSHVTHYKIKSLS